MQIELLDQQHQLIGTAELGDDFSPEQNYYISLDTDTAALGGQKFFRRLPGSSNQFVHEGVERIIDVTGIFKPAGG